MSYSIVTGPALIERLSAEISTDSDIRLAVAFWGVGAAKALGLTKGRKTRVICNLMSGGTNPSEIKTLQGLGIDVRKHPTLHAKIGIVGAGLSFVGSSNMSANGLGLEGREQSGWEEANVVFDHVDNDLNVRFESLWGDATPITKSDLEAAQERWLLRRTFATLDSANATHDPGMREISLWKAIVENDVRLRSAPCVIAYYTELVGEEAERYCEAVEEISDKFGSGLSAYMDWPELPRCFILDACCAQAAEKKLDDITCSRLHLETKPHKKGESAYQIVELQPKLPGFGKLTRSEQSFLKKLILAYIAKVGSPEESRIIGITTLMDFYAKNAKS